MRTKITQIFFIGVLLIVVWFAFSRHSTPLAVKTTAVLAEPLSSTVPELAYTHGPAYMGEIELVQSAIAGLKNTAAIPLTDVIAGVATHHIPDGISLLAEFYFRLKKEKNVKTFFIIGPDHFSKGVNNASISRAEFLTPFGKVLTDLALIDRLEKAGLVRTDEAPFEDHTIQSHLLFISRLFPDAKVVPILLRVNGTNASATAIGDFIGSICGANCFVVASVDFSHYLSQEKAKPLDEQSEKTLRKMNITLAGSVEADSPQALTAMMAAAKKRGADKSFSLGAFNSADFGAQMDSTTGYVVQFYGK